MAITSQPGVYPSIGEDGMKVVGYKQDYKFSVIIGNHLFQMTQSYAGGLDQLNSLDRILVQKLFSSFLCLA